MTVKIQRRVFTVEEYYKMAEVGILQASDRLELINGEIIERSPIKSAHANTVDLLLELAFEALLKKATIRSQNPLKINNFSEPEPDILIAKYQSYRNSHPTPTDVYCLIEVSDSTLPFDRTTKKKIYAEAGISEYWIVNIKEQQVEVFTNPKGEDYEAQQTHNIGETIACSTIDFEVAVKDLF